MREESIVKHYIIAKFKDRNDTEKLFPEIKALFVKAKLDFSILGIGLHVENAELVASNEEDAIRMMLGVLKKAKKKVLVFGI